MPTLNDVTLQYQTCSNPRLYRNTVHSDEVREFVRATTAALGELRHFEGEMMIDTSINHLLRLGANMKFEMRSPKVLLTENYQQIETVVTTLKAMGLKPDPLLFSIDLLSGLAQSPLTEALLSFNAQRDPKDDAFPIFIFGKTNGVVSARTEILDQVLIDCPDLCAMNLKDVRQECEFYESAVFIGSPRSFGDSLITCPIADESLFFYYSFTNADHEADGWEHPYLQRYVDSKIPPPCSPYWHNFEPVMEWGEQASPTTGPEVDFQEEVDRVSLAPLADVDVANQESQRSSVFLIGDGLMCALVTRARVIRLRNINHVDPKELEVGDQILLLVREPTQLAEGTMQNLVTGHRSGIEIWKRVQIQMTQDIQHHGWPSVRDRMRYADITMQYQYWHENGRLGPRDQQVFKRLCHFYGETTPDTLLAWDACQHWRALRIKEGHSVSDHFEKRAERLLKKQTRIDDSMMITLDNEHDGAYGLFEITGEVGYWDIPAHLTDRVLTRRWQPWRG